MLSGWAVEVEASMKSSVERFFSFIDSLSRPTLDAGLKYLFWVGHLLCSLYREKGEVWDVVTG